MRQIGKLITPQEGEVFPLILLPVVATRASTGLGAHDPATSLHDHKPILLESLN